MKDEKYRPISCDFYDRLEEAATLKLNITLRYLQDGREKSVSGRITDLCVREGVEWLSLDHGFTLRLDHLIAMNQWVVPGREDFRAC